MAKMHELLAIESDAQGQYKTIVSETTKVFKEKHQLFIGSNRKHISFLEDDKVSIPEENQAMASTVMDKLNYTESYISRYFDVMIQKEGTNQIACADLIIDDQVIAKDVPATFLLGLESRLKELRDMYAQIPTLSAGVSYEKADDIGTGVYRQKFPEEKLRTEAKFKSQILVPPTEHHPAQIEKWQEQVPTGKFVKNIWCGMMSSAEKHELMTRVDALLGATKKARQRANNTDILKNKIGNTIMNYLHRADLK